MAVNLETGKRIWHYQLIHHGIWDYDIPCAPVLADITVAGRAIKAVAQPTKQGFVYVFDRQTGQPVWPIEERPVPQSTVSGERTSPTQPFPTKPPAYERQGFSLDELIDFTPELKAEAIKIVSQYKIGPLFTPGIEAGENGKKGLLYVPNGANWVALRSIPRQASSTSSRTRFSGISRCHGRPRLRIRWTPGVLIAGADRVTLESRSAIPAIPI